MNQLRQFEEFLADGIAKKQRPDPSRSRYLSQEADKRYKFLNDLNDKIGATDDNANYFVETAYDIIMELIRAIMHLEGVSASGAHAHEAEVAYLRKIGISEPEVRYANELRYFRNGINYYGRILDKEYAQNVLLFLEQIRPALIGSIQRLQTNKRTK
ncbi:MAG: hypothetical protein AABX47_05960 [Nanoarchaeota archaeon]